MMPFLPLVALYAQAASPCTLTMEPKEVRPDDSVLLAWTCSQVMQVRLEPGGAPGSIRDTPGPLLDVTRYLASGHSGGHPLALVDAGRPHHSYARRAVLAAVGWYPLRLDTLLEDAGAAAETSLRI